MIARKKAVATKARRSGFVAKPSELGVVLSDLRKAKGFSLREVEQATGNAVSNAYLSQLENGKIKKPSPNVLHSLAEVYVVPYETLMEKAGYLLPPQGKKSRPAQTVGGFRDRRPHGRRRGGAPEVSGVPSLPEISFLGRSRLKLFETPDRGRAKSWLAAARCN
jgi:transcriptional regulator with XRE-family HTH domain